MRIVDGRFGLHIIQVKHRDIGLIAFFDPAPVSPVHNARGQRRLSTDHMRDGNRLPLPCVFFDFMQERGIRTDVVEADAVERRGAVLDIYIYV